MVKLSDPTTAIPGLGPVLAKRLLKLDLHQVSDLLFHFPTAYDDFSHLVKIKDLQPCERVSVRGKIQLINSRRSWKRHLTITEALITDNTGTLKAIWFNQPYLSRSLKTGDEIMLAGSLTSSKYGLQLEHPTWEPIARQGLHTGRLVPRYPLTNQLTQRMLRTLIARVLPLAHSIPDWLPVLIRKKAQLPTLGQAIHILHAPESTPELIAARRRVTFDELYLVHLRAKLAYQRLHHKNAPAIMLNPETKKFVSDLPWPLTHDQRIAAWEILKDVNKPRPMFRLLQGDVGSGKTIVAGLAAFNAVTAGFQVALLAPTEILAFQHFQTLQKFFTGWPIPIGLLSRGHHVASTPAEHASATTIKQQIQNGAIKIIIGTHALLQTSVHFHNLGLVIVDEQHRFGVEQRQILETKVTNSAAPHFLSLSATPIPRSLALTLYGELDVSTLKTLPAGRQPITTKIIDPLERGSAYTLMRQEVTKGNRVFIICPLIDESDSLGVRAATTERERLQREIFPEFRLGLLHGKLTSQEKTRVMEQFKNGTTPILVSTSVIEVGVDVPEATVMAIEGAERFGIAQLHQFRGRVGRSNRQSYCLLLTDHPNPASQKRLQALVKFRDGFSLAEFDLQQRGPGDLLGDIQAGWGKLKFAELADSRLLSLVHSSVMETIRLDSELTRWPELKAKVRTAEFHPE